ncbi:glucose-repressible protein Grg1 [Stachybotrys elegans]|uniref:Glucose-repressible protein Grg1 n=1 Tax=Stachybotrys elegans TaxID=80388 RepID=A0A8K0SN58_9HYPO|nr:glucose-repressible protein Grg1 [Stachybotrys elegans]
MESAKQAINYVAETIQGKSSEVSKETNKEVAQNPNANIGTRASAAVDAVGDKIDQSTHESKAEVHKQGI